MKERERKQTAVVLNDIKLGVWAIEMTEMIMERVDSPIDKKMMLEKMEELRDIVE